MGRLNLYISLILLGIIGVFPAVSLAQELEDGRAPLVTIRFNQPRVYFDQQLYSAVSKAVAAKPDVMFDVVTFAPTTGDPTLDRDAQITAGKNVKMVVQAMQEIGVPMERIDVIGRNAPDIKFDETRVYVR